MEKQYDLIVLGSGTAGQKPAYGCREAGWSVAIIDPRPPGGTCANRGCDAKKPYTNVAEARTASEAFSHRGLEPQSMIDWRQLHRFKTHFTEPIPRRTEKDFLEAGIDFYPQSPSFLDEQTVALSDGTRLRGNRFVIATGLEPRPLHWAGAELLIDSDAFLELESLPRRVLFVGGGYIAMEYAHAAIRAGVKVTVVERGGCPLNHADTDIARAAGQASRAAGIDLQCNACVSRVERSDEGFHVFCEQGLGFDADLVVHAAGRTPNVRSLNLDAAGVAVGDGGVVVNDYFQSPGNERVYAAGDVADTGGAKLTPVSGVEGAAVRENLLHGNKRRVDESLNRPTATCVFMSPPMASVGLSEPAARQQYGDDDLLVSQGDASGWKLLREMGRSHAAYKIIASRSTRRLVGVHLLMPRAEELINVFALAMACGLTLDEIRKPLYSYPTFSSHIGTMLPKL